MTAPAIEEGQNVASTGRLPDFIFVRKIEIEREGDFVLAGSLVTNFPRRAEGMLTRRQRRLVNEIVAKLVAQRSAEKMPDDALVTAWKDSLKPANAIDPPFDDDMMMKHMAAHLTIAIRMDPRSGGGFKIDRDLARQLGLASPSKKETH